MNYPEYIDGIKQEQNVFKRFGIRIWYSNLFRIVFILLGFIWIIPFCFVLLDYFPNLINDIRAIGGFIYFSLLYLAYKKNNFSNLRRIGRDEFGRKIYYEEEIKEVFVTNETYEEEEYGLCLSVD